MSLTYRFDDDSLYLLDVLQEGSKRFARLSRVSRSGTMSEMARVRYKAHHSEIFLTTTYDGLLLLSTSGPSAAGRPFYLLIDVSGAAARAVGWQRDKRPGTLIMAPDTAHRVVYSVAKLVPGHAGVEFDEVARVAFTTTQSILLEDALQQEPL